LWLLGSLFVADPFLLVAKSDVDKGEELGPYGEGTQVEDVTLDTRQEREDMGAQYV